MKAILNYKGFIKELEIKEPKPQIYIAISDPLTIVAGIKEDFKKIPISTSIKKWCFHLKTIKKEGFWIFKKPIAYYEFEFED